MLKIIFSLGLVSVMSLNLYGEVKKCNIFSSAIDPETDSLISVEGRASTENKVLKSIYDCVLANSKTLSAAKETPKQADYEAVIKKALILENSCISYISTLTTVLDRISAKPTETQATGATTKISSIYKTIYETTIIKNNSKTIASGVYALAAQNKVNIPVKDKVSEWKKDDVGNEISLESSSMLSALDKLNSDKTATDLDTKLSATLKGAFSTEEKIKEFKTNLKEAYDIKSVVGSTNAETAVVNDPNAAAKTTSTSPNDNNKSLTDILLAQYLANLANNNNAGNNNNNNTVAAPVLTSKDDKGSSGGGGSGSLAGASIGSRSGMDDDDRKDFLARAKEREKALMRMDLQRTLYGNSSGKPLPKNAMGKDGSSGSSLRDLFAKRFEDSDKTMAKKGSTPSIFGADSDEAKQQGDEKYKEYFKTGEAPSTLSSKELVLNRFTSMYETARLKALTEDADQEFAGRYIDLFLLVHTILDHEYRDKGKLIDLTEVIPSPLGPTPYKQRP